MPLIAIGDGGPRAAATRWLLSSVGVAVVACLGGACNKSAATRPAQGTGGASSGGADSGGAPVVSPGTGGATGQDSPGDASPPASTGGADGGEAQDGGAGSVGIAGQGGSGTGGNGGAPVQPVDAAAPDPIDQAFAATALQIAADYLSWGRVDDELRWAPYLCRIPLPAIARPSKSNDAATHGQKLYSVFAKNHDAYPAGPQDGQIVVKQSWTAELVAPALPYTFPPTSMHYDADAGDHFYGYAESNGSLYRAAEFAGLYIMFRISPTTPETDEGWVYATITADGQVTAAGRVASCMTCHEVATHERLFGVPLSPALPN